MTAEKQNKILNLKKSFCISKKNQYRIIPEITLIEYIYILVDCCEEL